MHARFIAARGQTHKGKATALCATRVHRHAGLSYVVWWNQPWRKWYQDNFFFLFFSFVHLTKIQIIFTFTDNILQSFSISDLFNFLIHKYIFVLNHYFQSNYYHQLFLSIYFKRWFTMEQKKIYIYI